LMSVTRLNMIITAFEMIVSVSLALNKRKKW
jgi:hypothetical protein